MTSTSKAREYADDIEKWMRANKLPLHRVAKWTDMSRTLRGMADDVELFRRRAEHLAYDLDQATKMRQAMAAEIDALTEQIYKPQ